MKYMTCHSIYIFNINLGEVEKQKAEINEGVCDQEKHVSFNPTIIFSQVVMLLFRRKL
jgi:hypothetical protein